MAKWEDIDVEAAEWFHPKANVKGGLADMRIYLSPFALNQFQVLHKIKGGTDWCFPALDAECHIGTKSMTKQIGDHQAMFNEAKDGGHARQ